MTHFLIVSLSRSGGKLLRMLLDGHPSVNAIPFEHWNRSSKGDFPARRIEAFARLSLDQKLATAGAPHVERKLRRFHPDSQVVDIMSRWRAASVDAQTLAAMYERFATNYFAAIGKDPARIVVNHCGSLCRLSREQLDALYGEGRHVLTIRDPRAVFASMEAMLYRKFTIKHVQKRKVSETMLERHIQKLEPIDGVSTYVREFCVDYRHMMSHHAARADVVRIRFEDLVTSPEEVTKQLAAQLAIPWDKSLLEPTEFGVARAANSSFGRQGVGIHSRAADDWVTRLSPATRRYLEENLEGEMAALGYQPLAAQV